MLRRAALSIGLFSLSAIAGGQTVPVETTGAVEPLPTAWEEGAQGAAPTVVPTGRYDSLPSASATAGSSSNNGYGAPSGNASPSPTTTGRAASGQMTPVGAARIERARVSKGSGKLPNAQGQVWREYDISPYTLRMTQAGEEKPQQVIVDWILRETGYESWHSETFGILNANTDTLTVYHTPAMQAIVADIVDRFVNSSAAGRSFTMRIVTVRNPEWRAKAMGMLTPISVQAPGLQAWIMPKENHALMQSEFNRRTDIREYNSASQVVGNARRAVFSTMRSRGYVKGIVATQNAWPGYQPEMGQLEEGATLEFNPLLSLDQTTAEAVIKLRLNQVERMRQVNLDINVPSANGRAQRLQVEVPQLTMANLHEKFRWPSDQVLLLSMGMVATPAPDKGNMINDMLPDSMKTPARADALLFIESHNTAVPAPPAARGASTATRAPTSFRGRY